MNSEVKEGTKLEINVNQFSEKIIHEFAESNFSFDEQNEMVDLLIERIISHRHSIIQQIEEDIKHGQSSIEEIKKSIGRLISINESRT